MDFEDKIIEVVDKYIRAIKENWKTIIAILPIIGVC